MLVCLSMGGGLEALLERVTIYFHGLYVLPLMLPYFYGSFVTFLTSSLLHGLHYALLYIFSEISTYLYDFQHVITGYQQISLNISILISFLRN